MARRYLWTDFDARTLSWTMRQLGTTSVLYRTRYFDELESYGKLAAQQADTVFFLIGFDSVFLGVYCSGRRYD